MLIQLNYQVVSNSVGIAERGALNPDIILFDEPTSALDPELVGEVLSVMKDIAKEKEQLCLLSLHEISFYKEVANRVIFTDDGVVVEEEAPHEILVTPKEERTIRFLKRVGPQRLHLSNLVL